MAYAQVDKPSVHFKTVLYQGDGSNSRAVTGAGFQPDLTLLKSRDGATSYYGQFHDSVRGATNGALYPALTNADDTTYPISSFDSDGFTLRATSHDSQNGNGNNFVAWNWKGAGSSSSNSDGTITTSVSANTTSGVSVATWSGTGSAGTIGHGLGDTPKFFVVKNRGGGGWSWYTYHASLGETQHMYITNIDAPVTGSTVWNSTAPTSSVVSLGTSTAVNGSSNNYVGYFFAEKKGFSSFGIYRGNGKSEGAKIYTGFKPAFVIVKTLSNTSNWAFSDNRRNGNTDDQNTTSTTNKVVGNRNSHSLAFNLSNNEDHFGSGAGNLQEYFSNGFRLRDTGSYGNSDNQQYIYMAFASHPFVGSNNTAATAY